MSPAEDLQRVWEQKIRVQEKAKELFVERSQEENGEREAKCQTELMRLGNEVTW